MSNYSERIRNMETLHDNWVDEREREYNKRNELLSKFMDGGRRYNNEQLFRNIIECLVRGADPFEIIEKLIDINKDLQEKIKEYLLYHGIPIIKPEHYEQSKPSK